MKYRIKYFLLTAIVLNIYGFVAFGNNDLIRTDSICIQYYSYIATRKPDLDLNQEQWNLLELYVRLNNAGFDMNNISSIPIKDLKEKRIFGVTQENLFSFEDRFRKAFNQEVLDSLSARILLYRRLLNAGINPDTETLSDLTRQILDRRGLRDVTLRDIRDLYELEAVHKVKLSNIVTMENIPASATESTAQRQVSKKRTVLSPEQKELADLYRKLKEARLPRFAAQLKRVTQEQLDAAGLATIPVEKVRNLPDVANREFPDGFDGLAKRFGERWRKFPGR